MSNVCVADAGHHRLERVVTSRPATCYCGLWATHLGRLHSISRRVSLDFYRGGGMRRYADENGEINREVVNFRAASLNK